MTSIPQLRPPLQPPAFRLGPPDAPCVCQFCGQLVTAPPLPTMARKPQMCHIDRFPEGGHIVPCEDCKRLLHNIYYWPIPQLRKYRHRLVKGAALGAYVSLLRAGATDRVFARVTYAGIGRVCGYSAAGVTEALRRLELAGYVECRRQGLKRWYRVLVAELRPKGE